MGMAEIVPGVSGGTIAFITGIYQELINTIKQLTAFPLKTLLREGIKPFWKKINGSWIMTLLVGMVGGILVGLVGVTYLLENYPPAIWSFFFGLIIASCIYMLRKIDHWSIVIILLLIIGAAIAYQVTVMTPAAAAGNPLFVFVAGAIAISALILPGISGSFILLLLGMYTFIIGSVKSLLLEFDFSKLGTVGIFALGCLVGLALFSNFLSWTFKRFPNQTLAMLIGFMLGSLNRIWPWRNTNVWLDEETGRQVTQIPAGADEHFKVLVEENVWISAYQGDPFLAGSIVAFLIGLGLVLVMGRVEKES